jgi:zinc transport system substrate-binding protein
MRRILSILMLIILISCNRDSSDPGTRIITVSIAPFRYFVTGIAGDDFSVNVMVPSGANPHIYEPYPRQIARLRKSVAYISNGYLGFEMAWLERFYEMNKTMLKLSVGERIEPIASGHGHGNEINHTEAADPHYWVSPKCARIIASSVRDLLCELNPGANAKYEKNCSEVIMKIDEVDKKAQSLFSEVKGMHFMIFHPNLAYLARDYGLGEIAVEFEGKEPPPSRLKELIDLAAEENINTIFVQKEYDSRNAMTIAAEIGAEIRVIDPLSENWLESTLDIINGLYNSLTKGRK